MPKKRRTSDERRRDQERYDARMRELNGHIERIKAELAAKEKPAEA